MAAETDPREGQASDIAPKMYEQPSLGSRGLKLVVKNTMLEFQPVSSDSIDPDLPVEDRDRRPKAFTDPPKASPKFMFTERRRSNSSELNNKKDTNCSRRSSDLSENTYRRMSTGTSLRTKSNYSGDLDTQYECDFECVEIASDTTDLDQFAAPEVTAHSWAAVLPAEAVGQMTQHDFSAMYNGYALPNPGSPMNLPMQWSSPSSPQCGYNGAPPLMPTHMPPPIQLEGKVEDLRAQAAAFEKAAENCKAAAAECDMLAGWASAAAHAPPYIPWSPMNALPASFGMSSSHSQEVAQGSGAPSRSHNAQSWGKEAEWAGSGGSRGWSTSSKEFMMPSSSSSGPADASWRPEFPRQNARPARTEALAKMDDDNLVVVEESIEKMPQDRLTTVMLRNLPNDYTREMLLDLLDSQGFAKCYDFVYMPIDFHRKAGLGYAFVNMVTHVSAVGVHERLMRFDAWETPSQKVLDVCWSEPSQGLEAHVERYRNSPVMHADVADKFKPLLFQDGNIITFPGPTKRIRPPRLKHGGHKL